MDIEGTEIWRDVRQKILKTGPLNVLRRLAGHDLEDVFAAFVDDQTVADVLDVLGEPLAPDADAHEAAVDALLRLAGGSRRLQGEQKHRADELVLRVFDAWAKQGDNPGAVQAGWVISALNSEIARWEFDSGVPGSGQVIRAHRFGRAIATVSDEIGVCGLYGSTKEMVWDWLDSGADPRQISGDAVSDELIARRQYENEAGSQGPPAYGAPLTRAEAAESAAQDERSAEAHERKGDAHAAASDFSAALREWRHAATFGRASAHWKLAVLFCRGLGADRSPLEASRRCRSAAECGDPRGQLRLARASERLLKYRDSDFWQRLAAESGLGARGLEGARRRRLTGSRAHIVRAAIERLTERFHAGERRRAVDLAALCSTNGRMVEAQMWWALIAGDAARFRVDDFLVLELSAALACLRTSPETF
jgi:TPR repeat protein